MRRPLFLWWPPGEYRLRLNLGELGYSVEQLVHLQAYWKTQVYLNTRAYGDAEQLRRADLAHMALLITRRGYGFDQHRDDYRSTELAVLALEDSTSTVNELPEDVMRDLSDEKFGNPMLGLFLAHLLLRRTQINRRLLHTVIKNLSRDDLLGWTPDLLALGWAMVNRDLADTQLREQLDAHVPIDKPPMLVASWRELLRADAARPGLLKGPSIARFAPHMFASGVRLSWKAQDDASAPNSLTILADNRELENQLRHWPGLAAGVTGLVKAAESVQVLLSKDKARKLLYHAAERYLTDKHGGRYDLDDLCELLDQVRERLPELIQSSDLSDLATRLLRYLVPTADPAIAKLLGNNLRLARLVKPVGTNRPRDFGEIAGQLSIPTSVLLGAIGELALEAKRLWDHIRSEQGTDNLQAH